MQFIKQVAPKFIKPLKPIVDSGVIQILSVLLNSKSFSSFVGSQDVDSNNLYKEMIYLAKWSKNLYTNQNILNQLTVFDLRMVTYFTFS